MLVLDNELYLWWCTMTIVCLIMVLHYPRTKMESKLQAIGWGNLNIRTLEEFKLLYIYFIVLFSKQMFKFICVIVFSLTPSCFCPAWFCPTCFCPRVFVPRVLSCATLVLGGSLVTSPRTPGNSARENIKIFGYKMLHKNTSKNFYFSQKCCLLVVCCFSKVSSIVFVEIFVYFTAWTLFILAS